MSNTLSYTGAEVQALLDKIATPEGLYKLVDELPSEPKENTIYLVPSVIRGSHNSLTEWAYINGRWEQFGEFEQPDYNEEDRMRSSFIRNKPGFIYADMSNYESAKAFIKKYDLLNKQGSALPCLFKHIDADKAVPGFMGIHDVSEGNAYDPGTTLIYRIDFCIPIVTTPSELNLRPEFVYAPGASLSRLSVHSYIFDATIGILTYLGKTISPSSEILRITPDIAAGSLDWAKVVASLPKYPVRIALDGYDNFTFNDPPGILMGGDTAFFLKNNQLTVLKITNQGCTKVNGSNYPMLTQTRIFEKGFDNLPAIIEALESGMNVRIKYEGTLFSVLSWRMNSGRYYLTLTGNVSGATTVYAFALTSKSIIGSSSFTLEDFAKKSDIPKVDWNESDESSKAFIKGRTHSIHRIDSTIVELDDQTIAYYLDYDYPDGVYIDLEDFASDTRDEIGDRFLRIQQGETKSVIYGASDFTFTVTLDFDTLTINYPGQEALDSKGYSKDEFISNLNPCVITKLSSAFIPDSIARKTELDALEEKVAALEEIINQITIATE